MKSVNFPIDEALHKKFKMICANNDVNIGKTIMELMQKYVKENEDVVSSPQIQGKLPPEVPSFYGDQKDWEVYVRKVKKNEVENFATRITFLKYLLYSYLIDRDNKSELNQTLRGPEYFKGSDDYKFLQKNRITHAVKDMSKEKNLPPIKII